MPVAPNTIAKDKCYVTVSNQVRHVIDVTATQVTYQARGKRHKPFPWGSKLTVDINTFAADVDREVPCHYDPDFTA